MDDENNKNDGIPDESGDFGTFFTPPFYGTGEMLCWHSQALIDSVDKEVLYGKYWKNGDSSTGKLNPADLDEMCSLIMQEILADQLVDGRGYYGFFPVIADKETLVMLDPDDFHTEIASFRFPEMKGNTMRNLAGFFRPEGDLISVQVVTAGFALQQRCCAYTAEKQLRGRYLEGVGRYLTDILAEKVTREVRRALSLQKEQGKRHAFGSSGMPDLSKQGALLEIMCAEERLGVTLDDRFLLTPEYSALDIIISHEQVQLF